MKIYFILVIASVLIFASCRYAQTSTPDMTVEMYEYENGALGILSTGYLIDDNFLKSGVTLLFHPNGVLKSLYMTECGEFVGNYFEWDVNGNLLVYRFFNKGKVLIEENELDNYPVEEIKLMSRKPDGDRILERFQCYRK